MADHEEVRMCVTRYSPAMDETESLGIPYASMRKDKHGGYVEVHAYLAKLREIRKLRKQIRDCICACHEGSAEGCGI